MTLQYHKQTNSLIISAPDLDRITENIPRSRAVNTDSGPVAQVHFGLDEVRVLRNLGINAPSPIRTQYSWRGKYKPFKHQLVTAEFFTLNRRAICLNDMGCVDASTEYLSPTGWKRMDEYDGGKVAQYWPESGRVEYVAPTQYVKKPCAEMIRFKTSRGVDQLLSPEHRVLYVTSTGARKVDSAENIEARWNATAYGWAGRFITTFLPDADLPGVSYTDAELRVQVAVIADGYFGNKTSGATMRLKKPRKVSRIKALLDDAGIPYRVYNQTHTGFKVFYFRAPRRVKEFDDEFWACNEHQLNIVAEECAYWDGSHKKAGAIGFYSTSKASADFIQYAMSASGKTASMAVDGRIGGTHKSACYAVHGRNKAALLYLQGSNGGAKAQNVWREPSPDGYKYCFMVPSTFLVLRRNGCVFATGNTGKSVSALWAADYLMDTERVRKAIIVTPLSTMRAVWENELLMHFMFNRKTTVLHGSKERRLKLLAEDSDFYVINHDGLKVIEKELRARDDIDLWIIDEAAAFRNAQTARYKLLKSLIRPTDWLWLMTGTPCPNAPTDAWALGRLLGNPDASKYFGAFKERTMYQVTQYKWIPKPDAYEIAYSILQPGIRFRKEDCLDLPPVTYQMRECEMTKEQERVYKEMHKHLVASVNGSPITAANAAVKLQKLLQVCVGTIYDNDGGAYDIDVTPRLSVLDELVEESSHKLIVFVPFKAALKRVAAHLAERWSVEIVDGDTPERERQRIFNAFQNEGDPRILVCHPKVTAHGITLTRADTTVWFAPIFSLETFQQANNRMDRPGQKNAMTVATIASTPMELELYKALEGKASIQESVLALYRKEVGK